MGKSLEKYNLLKQTDEEIWDLNSPILPLNRIKSIVKDLFTKIFVTRQLHQRVLEIIQWPSPGRSPQRPRKGSATKTTKRGTALWSGQNLSGWPEEMEKIKRNAMRLTLDKAHEPTWDTLLDTKTHLEVGHQQVKA